MGWLFTMVYWLGQSECQSLYRIATSREGRPIVGHWVTTENPRPKRTVLLVGGIHGDEILGFEENLAENLRDQLSIFPIDIGFFIIPLLNPDGRAKQTRTNAAGKDLNREWKAYQEMTEPEVRQTVEFLQQWFLESPILFSLDYHCCANALLTSQPLVRGYLFELSSLITFPKMIGNTEELLGYSAQNSFRNFVSDHFNAVSVTYEGQKSPRETLSFSHLRWLAELTKKLWPESS